jgi:hypothetical protein
MFSTASCPQACGSEQGGEQRGRDDALIKSYRSFLASMKATEIHGNAWAVYLRCIECTNLSRAAHGQRVKATAGMNITALNS